MIISYIMGGLGNQLWQYVTGRRLAHKWNTELKLDLTYLIKDKFRDFELDKFNTIINVATPEEIQYIKTFHPDIGREWDMYPCEFMPEVLDYPDNIWLYGYWQNEKYFADIDDIIRKELTLKQPLGAAAKHWQEKIFAANCSVSLHIRHGDFIYNPVIKQKFVTLPFDYYYDSLNQLKQQYSSFTIFVFSDDLQWCRENLRFDMPTEFVAGDGLTDVEELYLMSICKHNIIANSTFSWWGAWLNKNPDKKVFAPIPSNIIGTNKTYMHFSVERNETSPLDSDKWIRVPFDINKQPEITMRPYFSLLLVVNDDIVTLPETLESILLQDYKFYELIIIDNASTDGSGKICRQVAKALDNVTLIKLYDKVSNGAAWNKAIDVAQGNSLLFLKSNDKLLTNALTSLYMANERPVANIVSSVAWIREDDRGTIDLDGKKFVVEKDLSLFNLQDNVQSNFDKMTLLRILSGNENPVPFATRIFKREFLLDNAIRFNEKCNDKDAELLFTVDAMLLTEKNFFMQNPFYIAPKANEVMLH